MADPLAAILITHTTRHLRRTLLGVASASRKPDAVVVACDGDGEDLLECVRSASAEFGLPVTLALRAHTGKSRSPQVRNNAVRALPPLPDRARLVFLDGDCCPAADCFETHERIAPRGELVVSFRVDLTPEQTEAFDESAVRAGKPPATIAADQLAVLRDRQKRYEWALFWRRLGLGKPHKPKVLSANFSCTLGAYRAINGFDEQYIGWGAEDDDLGRRMYQSGVKPIIGIERAIVYHQWHATRAPDAWRTNAGADRFLKGTPLRAERGLENPLEQPPVVVHRFGGAA